MVGVYKATNYFYSEQMKSSFKAVDSFISKLLAIIHEISSTFDNKLSIKCGMRKSIIYWNATRLQEIKGTLMQIWKSLYMLVIWKEYPENFAFLIHKILELFTREVRKFLKK